MLFSVNFSEVSAVRFHCHFHPEVLTSIFYVNHEWKHSTLKGNDITERQGNIYR